jgi:hypothetical protein
MPGARARYGSPLGRDRRRASRGSPALHGLLRDRKLVAFFGLVRRARRYGAGLRFGPPIGLEPITLRSTVRGDGIPTVLSVVARLSATCTDRLDGVGSMSSPYETTQVSLAVLCSTSRTLRAQAPGCRAPRTPHTCRPRGPSAGGSGARPASRGHIHYRVTICAGPEYAPK